jgi:hypothetical protein
LHMLILPGAIAALIGATSTLSRGTARPRRRG